MDNGQLAIGNKQKLNIEYFFQLPIAHCLLLIIIHFSLQNRHPTLMVLFLKCLKLSI